MSKKILINMVFNYIMILLNIIDKCLNNKYLKLFNKKPQ